MAVCEQRIEACTLTGMQTNAADSAPSLPCWVDCLYLRKDEAPMNIQLPAHMDKPSFLAWLQGREGRFELVDGRVVMMTGGTMAHGLIAGQCVPDAACSPRPKDMGGVDRIRR